MTTTQKIITALFVTAASAAFVPAYAQTARQSAIAECQASGGNSADCACVDALNAGTKDALEDFKQRYSGAETVCNSQASSIFGTENRTGRDSSGALN